MPVPLGLPAKIRGRTTSQGLTPGHRAWQQAKGEHQAIAGSRRKPSVQNPCRLKEDRVAGVWGATVNMQ